MAVSGLKGNHETAATADVFIGKQSITFPRLGKFFIG